jgi:hypothetical protein
MVGLLGTAAAISSSAKNMMQWKYKESGKRPGYSGLQ